MDTLQTSHNISISANRVEVKGKFLYLNGNKFYIKGTTYGTFKPDGSDCQFPSPETVRKDFSLMAAHGFNAVRTYTVPPKYLFDLALEYDLKVMAGLPWEQHITFLDETSRKNDIVKRVREQVISCAHHPALLCYTIGNEIPAPIVRWYGKEKVENFLKLLYKTVKQIDPEGLVTYVNYPTTEYLDLSFLDFDCFNVYLETPEKLSSYVARLHNLSGDRPLVLAEIGLDSFRNGEEKQAEVLKWQIETIFAKGCAGMFIFAWTDEWWRGGFEIEDWDFGLVDRNRNAKLALMTVAETMQAIPFGYDDKHLPFISVAVCSRNGGATIQQTIEEILRLDYPGYEVIVVNDGSTDNLEEIVKKFPVKLISTKNKGLSSARNTALFHARGEIIAYIDDDAYPDPQWLRYLAYAYMNSDHAGIGGPNICPEEDKAIAQCVANAPGGPVHVLVSDEIAEHIPGCNMSFKRSALLEIGGFDPVYRTAGDDVDICWRIQASGKTIGFHPSALVWHHRRNSLKTYWKQQKGYGKAEALLEEKWPEKYNAFGHLAWCGRIYGNGWTLPIKTKKKKIFHGTWGTALFQSVYQPAPGFLNCIPLMPEWYLLSAFLFVTSGLGFVWSPLLWAWPVFTLTIVISVIQAYYSARDNVSLPLQYSQLKYRLLIIFLHLIQPLARLYGRVIHGLTPWRMRGAEVKWKYSLAFRPLIFNYWSERWKSGEEWLTLVEEKLMDLRMIVKRGNDYDAWDLKTGNGLFAYARGLLAIEEHGANKQYLRFRCYSTVSVFSVMAILLFFGTGLYCFFQKQWLIGGLWNFMSMLILTRTLLEKGTALNSMEQAVSRLSATASTSVIEVIMDDVLQEENAFQTKA